MIILRIHLKNNTMLLTDRKIFFCENKKITWFFFKYFNEKNIFPFRNFVYVVFHVNIYFYYNIIK
jgi:hypothetical protein